LTKAIADAPVAFYKGGCSESVAVLVLYKMEQFIYKCKKYDFDNLSQADIETLIEDKLQKNIDKVLHNWEEEGFWLKKLVRRSVITKEK
jgi:DNA topoisomerase-1